MRLIGVLQGEKKAFRIISFLKGEGIAARYFPLAGSEKQFELWVIDEDQLADARHWLTEFKKDPNDMRFDLRPHPIDSEGTFAKKRVPPPRRLRRSPAPLTRFFILICITLYIK